MDGHVFVWNLYGIVSMDISGSISRVLLGKFILTLDLLKVGLVIPLFV